MHLQQTKDESRETGGPQYYLHDIPDVVKDFLRRKGACAVVLRTPYGIARSQFMAVGRDHKLEQRKVVRGKVGHDRVQQAEGDESIGAAIRRWYGLKGGLDFSRIDVEVQLHPLGHFILSPTAVKMRGGGRFKELERPVLPLTFTSNHQSSFWRQQIGAIRRDKPDALEWAGIQIRRVVEDHLERRVEKVHEADLLRAAGALWQLGMRMGPYLVKSYDCDPSHFQFQNLPIYPCPVEVKKYSRGFKYQILRYKPLPRAVVLCIKHDLLNVPDDVDVVELFALAQYLFK